MEAEQRTIRMLELEPELVRLSNIILEKDIDSMDLGVRKEFSKVALELSGLESLCDSMGWNKLEEASQERIIELTELYLGFYHEVVGLPFKPEATIE